MCLSGTATDIFSVEYWRLFFFCSLCFAYLSLLRRRSRQRERLLGSPYVRLSVNLSPKCVHKNAIFSKTKHLELQYLLTTYWALILSLVYQNATGVPNVTTVRNVPKMTRMILVCPHSVLCISTWTFERTHYQFPKIQDGERPPYRSWSNFFFYCILGFDERRLSYRLRYTCLCKVAYVIPYQLKTVQRCRFVAVAYICGTVVEQLCCLSLS